VELSVSVTRISVQCLAADWTTRRLRFEHWQRQKNFSSSFCIEIGSGAHPVSCQVGYQGSFSRVKHGWGVTLTTHPHLVSRSRMTRSYSYKLDNQDLISGRARIFSSPQHPDQLWDQTSILCHRYQGSTLGG
jgi:hypothetical protein